jgi:hypothetical protein
MAPPARVRDGDRELTSDRGEPRSEEDEMGNQAKERTGVKVHVFVNRRKIDLDTDSMTGAELLRVAGFEGQEWDLLQLQGEGDPTGGELVMFDKVLELKNGDRFRVIPGNRTFGT